MNPRSKSLLLIDPQCMIDSYRTYHHGHFMYNFQISMGDFTGEELIQAAIFNDAELMKCLLEGECVNFINFQDRRGRTAVYTSVSNNSSRCLRILLEHGGNNVSSEHFLTCICLLWEKMNVQLLVFLKEAIDAKEFG